MAGGSEARVRARTTDLTVRPTAVGTVVLADATRGGAWRSAAARPGRPAKDSVSLTQLRIVARDEPGRTIGVTGDRREIESLISGLAVTVAHEGDRDQLVLAGPASAIGAAIDRLLPAGFKSKRFPRFRVLGELGGGQERHQLVDVRCTPETLVPSGSRDVERPVPVASTSVLTGPADAQ